MLRTFGLGFGVLAFLAVGCGSKSDSTAKTPAAAATTGLSANYTKLCVSCHGADGSQVSTGGTAVLKGTKLTAAQFSAVVRAGKLTMTKYTTTQITDADIAADYAILSK
jgi:mono/diheme cytochrome c family protein